MPARRSGAVPTPVFLPLRFCCFVLEAIMALQNTEWKRLMETIYGGKPTFN